MTQRRWLYYPSPIRGQAALYRVDNAGDSELVVSINNRLVSLGTYSLNFTGLKYHNEQLNLGTVTAINPPQPVTGLSITAPEERRTIWVAMPPGEFSGTVENSAECVASVGTDDVTSAVVQGVDGDLTVSGTWSTILDNATPLGPNTLISPIDREFSWRGQIGNLGFYFGLAQNVLLNTGFISGSSSYVFTSLTHRPTGYLSMGSDGTTYAQTKYFNDDGDMFADYFVISPNGQFTKTTYSFYQEVVTNTADFRGNIFNFVGDDSFSSVSLGDPIGFEDDFYANSTSNPATDLASFISIDIEAAAQTQDGLFESDLTDNINSQTRTVRFVKPLGTVKLLSAVALANP